MKHHVLRVPGDVYQRLREGVQTFLFIRTDLGYYAGDTVELIEGVDTAALLFTLGYVMFHPGVDGLIVSLLPFHPPKAS